MNNLYRYLGIDCLPTSINEKGCYYVIKLKDCFNQEVNLSFEDLKEARKFIALFRKNNYTNLSFEEAKNE